MNANQCTRIKQMEIGCQEYVKGTGMNYRQHEPFNDTPTKNQEKYNYIRRI